MCFRFKNLVWNFHCFAAGMVPAAKPAASKPTAPKPAQKNAFSLLQRGALLKDWHVKKTRFKSKPVTLASVPSAPSVSMDSTKQYEARQSRLPPFTVVNSGDLLNQVRKPVPAAATKSRKGAWLCSQQKKQKANTGRCQCTDIVPNGFTVERKLDVPQQLILSLVFLSLSPSFWPFIYLFNLFLYF